MYLIVITSLSQIGIVTLLTSRDQDGADKVATSNDPSVYLESHVAVVDESDRCIWNQGADGFIDVDNDDSFEIVPLRSSSIDDDSSGINSNSQKYSNPGISKSDSNLEEDIDISSFPYLQLDVKRRMMINIFDSTIAGCEISILPLMLHPNVTTERWFALTDFTTGEMCGKILVRLLFASAPTDTEATVNTDQIAEQKEMLEFTSPIDEQHLQQQHRNDDLCSLPAAPAIPTVSGGNTSSSTNTTSQQKLQEILNKRKELLSQTKGQGPANIMSVSSSATALPVDAPSLSDWLRSSSSSSSSEISPVTNTLPPPAPAIDLVSTSMTVHNSTNSDPENDDFGNSINRIDSSSASASASTAMHHSVTLDSGLTHDSTFDAPAEPDLSTATGLLLVEMDDRDDVSEVFIDDDEDDEDSSEDDNANAVQAELEQLSQEIHHMAHDIAATYPIDPSTGDPPSLLSDNI